MSGNNDWLCCGIPAPQDGNFDWRAKVLAEQEGKEAPDSPPGSEAE